MITFIENGDVALIDGYRFRKDKKTGYFLSSKKINGKRKRLHVYVWEKANGAVPKHYQVHHIDENKNNNSIDNLSLLTINDHLSLHGHELYENNGYQIQKRLQESRVKASEWHKSEKGREWHKKHYERMKDSLHQEYLATCKCCGKQYKTVYTGLNKFCSNNCKSKWRKKSGVDDVKRKCLYCGKEFKVNKYAKKKYCSTECSYKASPRGGDTSKNRIN